MIRKKCSFTGHRSISDVSVIKSKIREKLVELIKEGYKDFYNGGALGFDSMCALEIINLKKEHDITLNMVLPCENQAEKWNEYQKYVYNFILDNCDSVEYIEKKYTKGCMQKRNRILCEKCDLLFAFCQRNFGGTFYTLNHAIKLNKEILNLNDYL